MARAAVQVRRIDDWTSPRRVNTPYKEPYTTNSAVSSDGLTGLVDTHRPAVPIANAAPLLLQLFLPSTLPSPRAISDVADCGPTMFSPEANLASSYSSLRVPRRRRNDTAELQRPRKKSRLESDASLSHSNGHAIENGAVTDGLPKSLPTRDIAVREKRQVTSNTRQSKSDSGSLLVRLVRMA
jgi:hypothetical protein